MTEHYPFDEIERKWARRWADLGTHHTDIEAARKPYYNLMMFPYPSAAGLHVGNVYAFAGSDIHGRHMRAQGYDVFEPIGFDAFGIHSENHAIKAGLHPGESVPQNIANFRRQLMRMGAMFDWERVVDTTSPDYYRWSQWIFVKMFKAGLAYRKAAPVNWCPACKTVLANEQVIDGLCERCDSRVEAREMMQWFFRITRFAEKLLDNLERIDWSRVTTQAQRNWIGKQAGAEIDFEIRKRAAPLTVFTTRPETVFGATFLVIAPQHPSISTLTTSGRQGAVAQYLASVKSRSPSVPVDGETGKTGVFTGSYARNPANGASIPIWVSDYVLMAYGTGAIMGVPAHDRRDNDFAVQYGLPVRQVISPDNGGADVSGVWEGEGTLMDCGGFAGLNSREGASRIIRWLEKMNNGRPSVSYRLRDWCISRQRYWGPPIPIIHCRDCGTVPVPEAELPVLLPDLADFRPDGSGISPLAKDEGFVSTTCPRCQGAARRETDVSDNFLDSAWYFYRYPCTASDREPFDPEIIGKWLPVDMYIGGNEHAVLHLMYTRFITMAFQEMGLVEFDEPFKRFRAHGLIIKDGAKMSKSKGNVINPDDYFDQFGADVLRTYLMFIGPYEEGGDFRSAGISGIKRFYDRLWRYAVNRRFSAGDQRCPEDRRFVDAVVATVSRDMDKLRYNTAIARLMEMLNRIISHEISHMGTMRVMLQLLCPFAPFISHELWERLGLEGMVGDAPWPRPEKEGNALMSRDFVVQVNGKLRLRLKVDADMSRQMIEDKVLASPRIRKFIEGKTIRRTIYVPGKLVNLVAE